MLWVASYVHRDCGGAAIDLGQVVGGWLDRHRAKVLLEPMTLGRPWDRDDPGLLRQQPRERDLRGRRLLPLGEGGQPLDEREIRFPVLGGEARDDVAKVGTVECGRLVDLPCQKALAERAERDEADAKLL